MTHEMYLALTIAICLVAFCLCFTFLILWFVLVRLVEYLEVKTILVGTCNGLVGRLDDIVLHCKDSIKARVISLLNGVHFTTKGVQ